MYSKAQAAAVAILCYTFFPLSLAQLTSDGDKLLNWCLDSKFHKTEPGPEGTLFKQCSPWKDRSCCTYNTTYTAHQPNTLYKFNHDHCSHVKNMSQTCRNHFIQEMCFFECSPNTGPWVVKVDMKVRKERLYQVPLCRSDCETWFDACREEYTCTDNWIRNFKWSKDGNSCLPGTECKTYEDIFKTAENFCQKIWDDAFQVKNDDEPCMRLWFDGNLGNPNDKVAKYYVQQMQTMNSINSSDSRSVLLTASVVVFLMLIVFIVH